MIASPTLHSIRLRSLELAAAIQAGSFLAATTWALGGGGLWLRPALGWLGSLSVLVTLAAVLPSNYERKLSLRSLRSLWPLLAYNLLVLISMLTPGFRELHLGSEILLLPLDIPVWKPTAALPAEALFSLWLFDVIYLSCFNLMLVVRRRSVLRGVLVFAAGNALALALFGIVQRLARVDGPFFGAVKTRQVYFFSTFIYHNHWGAFMILMTAICLALVWRHARQSRRRNFFHSPAFTGLVAVFVMTATVPMSGSRSCTALIALLLGASLYKWISITVRRRRERGEPIALKIWGALAGAGLVVAGIGYLAGDMIAVRAALTRRQIASMQADKSIGSRVALYRDTWRMTEDRPLFGWGLGSYSHVFMRYNTQKADPVDKLPRFYSTAHNDWLQTLAENGFIGAALLGLCALVPLRLVPRTHFSGLVTRHLLTGCAIILAYAWLEFPFQNLAVLLSWWLCFFTALRYAELRPVA